MSAGDSESSLLEANVTLAGASLDARSASSAGQKRMVTVHSCFKLLEPADLRSSHPMWMESLTIHRQAVPQQRFPLHCAGP